MEFESALKELLQHEVHLHLKLSTAIEPQAQPTEKKADLGWETIEEPL